jgi:signal transduction histidine kinase
MRHNVLALERLVEDLFLLARADSGRLALQAEPLDLAELIDEAIDAMAPAAAERRVRLVGDLSEPIFVTGDAHALGRVLRNLLDNAVRHSPDEGAVRVAAIRRRPGDDAPAGTVEVTVIDNGPGFDVDFVPRALERFSQADSARSRQGGAGLGLAISHTLVTAHGGTVSVHPGPGGRVAIELPLG